MAVPRGSVFGALLLIAIGALFLWANLNPAARPWPLIARYWPLLIIFWGLSKLFDYFAARGTPEAASAARLGAGDIFLLIFILLLGTAVSRATQRGFWEGIGVHVDDEAWEGWFEGRYQFTQQLEQQIETPASLSLVNQGNVALVAREGDRLQATIRKTAYGPSEAEAERRAKEVEAFLDFQKSGAVPSYKLAWRDTGAKFGPLGKFGPLRADIELSVPARLSTELEVRRGDLRIIGLEGDVRASVDRGAVQLSQLRGNARMEVRRADVRADNVAGNVEVHGSGDEIEVRNVKGEASIDGEYSGPIRAANVGGRTRFVSRRTNLTAERLDGELELDRGDLNLSRVAGNVTLVAEDKDIHMDEIAGEVRIENRTGMIRLRLAQPPREPIEITSRNGDIELILPANSSFTLNARAPEGNLSSDFTGPGLTLKEERGDAALIGNYGRGGPDIRLHTRHGSIRILRATAAGTAPRTSF